MLLHTSKHLDATVTLTASKPNETEVGCAAPTSPLSWPRNKTHVPERKGNTEDSKHTKFCGMKVLTCGSLPHGYVEICIITQTL